MRLNRSVAIEVAAAAAVILACAFAGAALGWAGPGRTDVSTRVWPFYLDTWFTKPQWSWRVVLPLAAFAVAALPVRAWLRAERPTVAHLVALIAGAYLVHVALGMVRFGFEAGLAHTFSRPQEY